MSARLTIRDVLEAVTFFALLTFAAWAWGLILTGGN